MPDPETAQETGTETAISDSAKAGQETWYVTTAIPYVNAPPHIGFALEMIQADVLARYRRGQGYQVRFQAGSDENSLKNVQAAEAAGLDTETLVAANARKFLELGPALNLSVDDFIRTSAEPRHARGVQRLWRACAAAGDIYKKAYSGLYCVGCEQFYKPAELRDGLCPEHRVRPEEVAEENYFFRLSRHREALRAALVSRRVKVEPASRRNEVLRWIEDGLEDFSISRSSTRARGWGIPVPGDASQVIYVWFDALGNYLSALGYGDGGYGEGDDDVRRFWCAPAGREQVIGKGITRFHAVYWPAMLLSAGLPLPDRILVHGYVTVEGEKIGKSAGNAVDPLPLARDFGADALRYYLLRHIRSTEDGDFSEARFRQAYDSELAGQLGNLQHRTLSMIERYFGGIVPDAVAGEGDAGDLSSAARALPEKVGAEIEAFALHAALAAIWDLVARANKQIAETEPWSLAKAAFPGAGAEGSAVEGSAVEGSARAQARLRHCLWELATALSVIGRCLAPFLPATSARLLHQLGLDPAEAAEDSGQPDGRRVRKDGQLFPRLDP